MNCIAKGGSQVTDQPANIRPYKINDVECRSAKELAAAIRANSKQAAEHFSAGYIGKWLEEDLRDYDAKIAHDKLVGAHIDYASIVYLAQTLDPDNPPHLYLVGEINRANLLSFFEERRDPATGEFAESAIATALLLFREGLIRSDVILKHAPELEGLADAWQSALDDYLKARGEMLLQADIWNDPSGKLAEFIDDDRKVELGLAQQFSEGRIVDAAYAMMLFNGTAAVLFDLLKAGPPYSDPVPAFTLADHPMFEPAIKRRWFADLNSTGKDLIGRQALLRDIIHIPAHETVLKGVFEKVDPADGIEKNWFERLPRPAKAGLLGGPLFLLTMLFDRDTDAIIVLWLPLILFAALFAAASCAIKLNTKAAGWVGAAAFVVAFVFFIWWEMQGFVGTFTGALMLGAIGGGLGWASDPLLERRIQKEAEAITAKRMQKFGETGAKLTINDLRRKFFPPRLEEIPMPQRTMEDYRRDAALRHGDAVPGDWSADAVAVRKSGVAPNHGPGMSYNIAGINVASDGTRTYELVDGVSFDEDGGYNTRVVDGVTLHSDGNYTTRVTKGVDIRSDGQVSTEVAGFRFSFGGKEKKKDEWDWGTGQKKEKGWFD